VKALASWFAALAIAAMASPASALPPTFLIDEIYSNADGSVQFIVVYDSGRSDCDAGENLWSGLALTSSGPEPQKTFLFPANLPTCKTSGRRILIASEGFAALGLVAPDFVIPNRFIQAPAGAIDLAGVAGLTYSTLPTDGTGALDGSGHRVQNLATNLAGASTSLALAPPAAIDIDQQGLGGSWYQAETSGQGIELEVFADLVGPGVGYLQGSWFTFDAAASGGADHGRWYTFGGTVNAGTSAATLPLYRNVGGNFDAPPVTTAAQVGTVTMTFADCTSARFDYAFTDGTNRSGSVPLTRLTPNVLCAPAGSLPGPSDFGLSGNWFDPAKGGQGLVVEVNPVARIVFMAWYTYAVNGQAAGAAGQRWYTAQASYVPGARTMPVVLYETTGGLLDRTAPAPATASVGTATLAFTSCNAATLAYAFAAGSNAGQAGSMSLVRVGPVPAACAF
jgi:hypothetical protein